MMREVIVFYSTMKKSLIPCKIHFLIPFCQAQVQVQVPGQVQVRPQVRSQVRSNRSKD